MYFYPDIWTVAMAQEGPEAVQAAIEPAVPSDPAAKGAGSVSGAGVGQQDAPDHSLMENMEGAGNAKDGETNDAQDPLVGQARDRDLPYRKLTCPWFQNKGTGSVQVEFEEPTVLNITFGNFTQRPVSKLPPEVVKTVAPAPSKEKKKDPYHIFPISQMLQSAGNFVGTVEWRVG